VDVLLRVPLLDTSHTTSHPAPHTVLAKNKAGLTDGRTREESISEESKTTMVTTASHAVPRHNRSSQISQYIGVRNNNKIHSSIMTSRNTVSALQDDDDLAKAALTSLWIGSQEVVDLASANFQEPIKKHPGLYSATISDTTMCSMGVPGFPDFPDCWMGGESYPSSSIAAAASRNKATNNKDKRAQRKQKRIVRKAVNHIPNREKNRGQKEQRLHKWRQLVHTRLKKQKVRKDMREIRSKLASLKW
jgi:hypothetical protein